MKHDSPLVVAALLLGAFTFAHAEDVRLEWQPDKIGTRVSYYLPMRLELSATKPEGVTKTPDGIQAPLYGTLKLGPRESATKAFVLLDEPEGAPARLWIDRNGNGDLTDDPPVKWEERKPAGGATSASTWVGAASIEAAYGAEKRSLGLSLYRFDKNDPRRAALRNVLLYYRAYGFAGKVSLEGTTYPSLLLDDATTGDFRGTERAANSGVNLLLDLNGDGKFDVKAERFDVRQPFTVSGTTYEIAGLNASGGTFTIAKSSKTAAELPKAPKLAASPFVFEQTDIAGQAVRFPEDYTGKLVMLDFWATWCGPCLKELPGLVQVYEEFHARGFEILGVSLDDANLGKLPKFAQDKGMTWRQVCDGKAWTSPIAGGYSVSSIPSAFLVDGKTGVIVAMGPDLRGEKLRATVEECLSKLGTPAAERPLAATTPPTTAPSATPSPPLNPATDDPVVARANALMTAGKLLAADAFASQKQNPQPDKVVLPAVGTSQLTGREIARRAAAGYLRAGWFFQCTKCGRWHTNLAGGYAIATDTVVTAYHVMQPPENMKAGTGYPIFVRGDNEVLPVTAVLGGDATIDAIVLRAGVNDLKPLPLGTDVQVGDSVWCLSDPRGERNYFSSGIVNRLVARNPSDPRLQRINVSTDWAPGSSGAAVLDGAGNVVGHVATIRALFSKPPTHPPEAKPGNTTPSAPATAMNLHEAIPAKSVLTLIPH